jgi:ABC-type antimicrobial peptide transport system permease subunit
MLFLTEYGLSGFVAGAVGAAGALLLSWGYLEFVAEFEVTMPLLVLPAAALACGLLTAVCGVAASARALRIRPIEALR